MLISCLYYFILGTLVDHPIHISRTEFNINRKEKEIQVSARIYIDDLELALKEKYKKETKMFSTKEIHETDQLIQSYLNQKISAKVNDKLITFTLIGKEQSEDFLAVWCYLEAKQVDIPKTMSIENRVLQEIYNDQRNMTEISIDGQKKKWFMLEINHTREQFTF